MLKVLTSILMTSCLAAKTSSDGKCRILVLRGGGVHGAYEAGALQAMIENLDPIDYAYDYISGVSVGAINAAILANFEKGQEAKGLEKLQQLYVDVSNSISDIMTVWPYIYVQAFFKNSVLDTTKAFEFFTNQIGN